MKRTLTLLACFFTFFRISAQSPPSEMHFSQDGHMLMMGDLPTTGFYNQNQIRSIYLYFNQSNWWQQLYDNYWNWTHKEILAKMVVDGKVYDSVGVRFKGQSSFQQVEHSQKKSFNISLDFVKPDQKIKGYKTLNLNNAFDDRSFMREIVYETLIKNHIPAAKVNYVKLYLNDEYWGLYVNSQQINKQFYKEWYMTNDGTSWRADRHNGVVTPYGDGTGSLNYLGPDEGPYFDQYMIKSTSVSDPWDDLIHTCDVLNNTPLSNLPDELPKVLDVDRTLWFLASEILFSDDDSYVKKGRMDYFAYWEKETGRIAPQEYDGNTVMNPNYVYWSPFYNEDNPTYPLMNKLFAVPEYRQRYLAHMRTLIKEYYESNRADSLIDAYKAQIDAIVQGDPKKLYSHQEFVNEVQVLKTYITNRTNKLKSNSEVSQQGPQITDVAWYTGNIKWDVPGAFQETNIRAKVNSSSGIHKVYLYYSDKLFGNFARKEMYDDGQHNDLTAGDGVFGASMPGTAIGSWNRFYIEAAANNSARTVSYEPAGAEHNVYAFVTGTVSIEDPQNESTLTVFPNPATDKINVYAENIQPETEFRLLDMLGQVMYSTRIQSGQFTIDVNHYPKGMYFLRFENSGKQVTRKIIIQ